MNVQAGSPDRGARAPLQIRFTPGARLAIGPNWLACLPLAGSPLRERHTYALVVTRRLRGVDGTPVLPSPDWLAVRGGAPLADPDLTVARTAAQPLLDWLDEAGGDERIDVVAAAVFTTQTTRDMVQKLRGRISALAPPVLVGLTKTGTTATHAAYDGTYSAPNFQTGSVPYATTGGEILLDSGDGLPVVQSTESLRVSFTIPLGTAPAAGWPVVLYAHGTGGDYHSFQVDGTAQRLAQRGLAVLSIDQVLHGERNPGGSPAADFYNGANPLAARDNTLQDAADLFFLARVAESASFVADTDTIDFDGSHVSFFGHSQGGQTGPPFLAAEGGVQGAVLSGTGGVAYLSMLHKTAPFDLAATVESLVADGPLDRFHPVVSLIQTWLERADPVNYGRLLTSEPLAGIASKALFLSEGPGRRRRTRRRHRGPRACVSVPDRRAPPCAGVGSELDRPARQRQPPGRGRGRKDRGPVPVPTGARLRSPSRGLRPGRCADTIGTLPPDAGADGKRRRRVAAARCTHRRGAARDLEQVPRAGLAIG